MRILSIFIICGFIALPSTLRSATLPQPGNTTIFPPEEVYKKLTFKEKISFLILKHTSGKEVQNKKGNTALIFALVGVGLFIIGLFVPFVILGSIAGAIVAIILGSNAKKQDPSDNKARAAVILGWITLGATALLLILAAIVVATWGL